jgi:peptidoglycan/xylan/chitin deacetylase (PgdA/CDA1 family)
VLSFLFKNVFKHGNRREKRIALTFDDGPHPQCTLEILQVLKSLEVKATFFLVGTNVRKHPVLSKKIAEEGHEIGVHSFWHRRMLFLSRGEVESEIDFAFGIIGDITGQRIELFRPPFGIYGYLLPKVLKEKGAKLILWDVNSKDWKLKDSERISANVIRKVKGGSILLFHDGKWSNQDLGYSHTTEALKRIIPALKERGFSPATISQLLNE